MIDWLIDTLQRTASWKYRLFTPYLHIAYCLTAVFVFVSFFFLFDASFVLSRFIYYYYYCWRTEVWPCYPAAKRFALAAGARTYHIQTVRSDVQMSQRFSTAVSVWTTPASHWPWVKAEAAIVINSTSTQLVVPCMRRSTIGDRTFTVAAPRAWNSLPDSLHRLSSLEQFKSNLRNRIVCDRKALVKQLVMPTALYKLSKLNYITLHYIIYTRNKSCKSLNRQAQYNWHYIIYLQKFQYSTIIQVCV